MRKAALFLLFVMLFTPNASFANNIVIEEGTEILLKVIDRINSRDVTKGAVVRFLVEQAVRNEEGFTLIEDDANAYGTVLQADKAGMFGKSGNLEISIDKVEAFNGKNIPLRGSNEDEGTSSTGAVVAGALLVSPLAILFRGDNAVIQSGTILTAYVDKTTVLSGDVAPEADNSEYSIQENTEYDEKFNELLKKYKE